MHKGLIVVLTCFLLLFVCSAKDDSLAVCTPPAKIVGDPYSPQSIQDAYDYASTTLGLTDFTLQLSGEIFTEDLFLDGGSVVLDGGYDCSFTTKNATTSIFGTVSISSGAANLSGINVVSTDRCDFDADLDGFSSIGSCIGSADDCNDHNADVYPGAVEICDGLDNDCNGQIDDGFTPTDADGDGYYGSACGLAGEDCNDNDASIHPGALDTAYDGIDQDCNGADLTFDDETCYYCHAGPSFWTGLHDLPTSPDPSCTGCHAPFVSNILLGHYGRTVLSDGNGMTAGMTIVCKSCHDPNDALHKWGSQTVWPKVLAATPNIGCDTCHENRASGHETAAAHDNRIIIAECGTCHTSDTANIGPSSTGTLVSAADVDTLHRSACDLCHNYIGSKLNTTTVRQVIAQGVGGTPVNCTTCHTDKATNHIDFVHPISVGPNDLSYDPPGILCGNCHNVSTWAEIEGVEHNVATNGTGSCATCHNSTRQEVINSIARALNPTYCLDCHSDKELTEHGMVDHEALGYVTGGTTYCLNCHDGIDTVADTHRFDCFLCHTSLPALKAGLPIYGGTPISCTDCHTNTWDGIHATSPPSHNALVQIATSNCGDCHSDPPPLADAVDPKVHDACSSCHDSLGGLVGLAVGEDFITGGNCITCHGANVQTAHPSCTSCHGEPPSGTTAPNRESAHAEHAVLGFGSVSPICGACHNGATHFNGTTEVVILTNFDAMSGSASSNGSTCSSTSCHGGQTTPAWSTGSIDVNNACEACHAEGTTQYNSYSSGKHWKHTGVGCTECHSTTNLAIGHFTNLETSVFEQDPVTTIGGSDTAVGSYDGNRCSNISCHNDKGW